MRKVSYMSTHHVSRIVLTHHTQLYKRGNTMNTKRHYLYSLISLLTALLAFGGLVFAVARGWASSSAQAAAPMGKVNAAPADPNSPGDWPMYGHDNQRTNYNPDETTINAGNVSQLVQRWQ